MNSVRNFADPDFEPTDEQWQELLTSAFANVAAERQAADEKFWAEIRKRSAENRKERGAGKVVKP